MDTRNEVFVIGHKNPDTDSICSAIAYAYLKNTAEHTDIYKPRRAGEVNTETAYVLDRFGADYPEYVENVRLQVRDMAIYPGERVDRKLSIRKAWEILHDKNAPTLAVVDKKGVLQGLISIGDIAKSIMDVHDHDILAKSKTSYKNIVETIEAEVLAGDIEKKATGKVIIAAANPDQLEEHIKPGDMVILGDRYEAQLCAIEMEASCIVVCINSKVNENVLKAAQEHGCVVLRTHYDTFMTARLLNHSIPIEYFMISSGIQYFRLDDYIEDIKSVMAKVRHREFPVFDKDGKFVGMVTRHSLLEMDRKNVILVDHNEEGQAVNGLKEAELEEIIDHHKLGFVETLRPVLFRNMPVGCTSTIIYTMYKEKKIEIPPQIAGLMCSAIISDTLLFRSPTCTPLDKKAATELGAIAGIDMQAHAKAMFTAGSNLAVKTEKDIFYQDFKKFTAGDVAYGVGQISSMDGEELRSIIPKLSAYMEKAREDNHVDMVFFMLTDILEETTDLICVGEHAYATVAEEGEPLAGYDKCVHLSGVVSRKKQVVPMLMKALAE